MPVIGSSPTVALDHILIATDFTPASEAALKYAEAFAKRFAAKLTLTNLVDLSMAVRSEEAAMAVPLDTLRHDSAENLDRAVAELTTMGLRADSQALEARNPAARVVRLTKEVGADLLILGTHGRKGVSRFVLGSFAEAVIHHADCPVVTIGPGVNVGAINDVALKTVLFATDLNHQSIEKAAIALWFAEESMAKIFLCHVVEHPSPNLTEALEQQLKAEATLQSLIPAAAYDWCTADCGVEYGDPADKILNLAKQLQADLIVLGARRTTSWFPQFVQGVAATVIGQATCPVMTICTD